MAEQESPYQRILIPHDGSESSDNALDGAFHLAAELEASVHIAHVTATPDIDDAYIPDIGRAAREHGQEIIDETQERTATETAPVTSAVLESTDPVYEVIAWYADEADIDCIVMARQGRSGIRQLALGSITERTLRTAPVPVLTLGRDIAMDEPIDRILLPTDGSDGAQAAIRHATAVATAVDASLHILHVVDVSAAAGGGRPEIYEALQELGAEAIDTARTYALDADVRSVEASIVSDHVDRSIIEYTDSRDIDLLVMGTQGRSGVRRLWLGSETERVIRQSPRPVLAVKPQAAIERLSDPDPTVTVRDHRTDGTES